jgi:hypothetical protein
VALPGYPMDNIVPYAAEAAAANTIGFSPTATLPFTDVQAAIEGAAALSTDQSLLANRPNVPFVTGGTGNDYTITPTPAITAYTAGQTFTIRPDRENTGAATLNINGLGARNLYKTNAAGTPAAIVARELIAGREVQVYDDGTQLLVTGGRDNSRYGTSANGTWVQFSDGTMLAWVRIEFAGAISTSGHYGGFISAIQTWTYPVAFISAPDVGVNIGNATAFGADTGTVTTTTVQVYATAVTTQISATRVIRCRAIGRWF